MKVIESTELNKRRSAYLRFLIQQIIVFISGSVLMSMAMQGQFGLSLTIVGPIHFLMVLILNVTIYLLLSRFFGKWSKIAFLTLIILTHTIQILLVVVKVDVSNPEQYFRLSQLMLFVTLSITLITVTKDIFLHSHDTVYSLLGAANIYLGTPITFATIYSLLESLEPGLLGIQYVESGEMFFKAYNYSWYVVTGLENPIAEGVNSTILNIAAFESALANLFIIFVVGRLMSK